jgi:hypothetical protein
MKWDDGRREGMKKEMQDREREHRAHEGRSVRRKHGGGGGGRGGE